MSRILKVFRGAEAEFRIDETFGEDNGLKIVASF